MRIACPPVKHPCHYGIDFPSPSELIAANMAIPEIAKFIEVDTLGYLSLEGLLASVRGGTKSYCSACYSGTYPVTMVDVADKLKLERSCG